MADPDQGRSATETEAQQLERLRFLHHVARLATTAQTWEELLETVVDGTRDALRADVSSLYLLDRDGTRLTLAATTGLDRYQIGRARVPFGEGITGRVAAAREPMVIPDVRADPRFLWVRGLDQRRFVSSMLSVPLSWHDQVVGVLNVQTERPRDFRPEDVEHLRAIADILAELGISKGAFYHYFDSKSSLLEALVEKMRDEAVRLLQPIFEDPNLAALEKIQRWFDTTSRWKTDRKAYLLSLLRVWYHDDNAVVVQKLRSDSLAWIGPLFGRVVHQGIQEGVFNPSYPDHVGQVVFSLLYDLGDTLARMILSAASNGGTFQNAQATAAAYTDALERALGAPRGSLSLVDGETLREWFDVPIAAA